jgi:hypothetical protein
MTVLDLENSVHVALSIESQGNDALGQYTHLIKEGRCLSCGVRDVRPVADESKKTQEPKIKVPSYPCLPS